MKYDNVNYIDYGTNKKGVIVLLHGWGQNIEMMDMLGRPFQDEYRIIVLDLPGFGKSEEPNIPWGVEEYTSFLHEFLKDLKVDKPILVGHSFGGRITISYSSKYETEKAVLLSSPFRPNQHKKVSLKTRIYKIIKKLDFSHKLSKYLKEKWSSEDYKNASEIMRGSLVKVVNDDLSLQAQKIKCPVLLIYGALETDVTSVEEARELEKLISDSGLVVYPNCHHYAYLENLSQTLSILNNFFE